MSGPQAATAPSLVNDPGTKESGCDNTGGRICLRLREPRLFGYIVCPVSPREAVSVSEMLVRWAFGAALWLAGRAKVFIAMFVAKISHMKGFMGEEPAPVGLPGRDYKRTGL